MLFLRIFQHLLPRSPAWRITTTKTLRKFFEGLSAQPALVKTFMDQVYEDLFPATARMSSGGGSGALEEWERQFGLVPNPSEAVRRAALAAEWQANGGQSPAYIEGVLQTAGFPVYVHDWWASGPPYAARDPHTYTTRPLIGTYRCSGFASQPTCSDFLTQPRCNRFLSNDPHYLVNKDLTRQAPPPVPDDPTKYPHFMYVGGEVFGTRVIVDATRRDELERLLLKLRPTQLWIVLLIDYFASGAHLLTEAGEFISAETGDLLTA